MPITADSEWRLTGDTDLSSFTKAVSRSFTSGSSPVAKEAADVYGTLLSYGLTRLGAAFLWHETKNGSWNCSTAPQGQPCIPASNRNPFAMKNPGGGWAVFDSYAEAADEWASRLLSPNGPYRQTGTIAELIDVYAPEFENDVEKYREVIVREVNALPEVTASAPVNPWPKPRLFDLKKDYAAFGLTKRQADKILSHHFADRAGVGIRALVCHVQEGTSVSSLSWWSSGNADASSSVMVQKDGSLLRIIEDSLPPWTNGDVQQPSAKGKALIDAIGGANPNLATLSIEAEGYTDDDMPEAQARSICWMLTEWMLRYDLTVADIYKHADFNSVTRNRCPGRYWDTVMGMLKGEQPAPAPDPKPPVPFPAWPGKPSWLPDDAIPYLFPEADPAGKRTRGWLAYCTFAKRAPARKAFLFKGTERELILFDDGLLIDLEGRQVGNP